MQKWTTVHKMEAGVAVAIDLNRHHVCFVFKLRSGCHPETVPQASNNTGKQGRKPAGRGARTLQPWWAAATIGLQ